MADPTMQTFCCLHDNGTDVVLTLTKHLDTHAYNIVCILSSTLGIIGGIYQILPRQQYLRHRRWLSYSSTRGRKIIVSLAVADLFASLGVLMRSIIWLKFRNIMPCREDNVSIIFCIIFSVFVQYFYTVTWIWTFFYALDVQFILKEKEYNLKYFNIIAWITPIITTLIGLSILYIPDADCHISKSTMTLLLKILPNYIITYVPIILVMIYNPFLYSQSMKDMERIIPSMSGQFTSKERDILEAIKIKFFLINLVFYICWAPNLINGLLLWLIWCEIPLKYITIVWYTMAFLNPLQAFLNSLVYRKWNNGSERIIFPWRVNEAQYQNKSTAKMSSGLVENRDEMLPLLGKPSSTSINKTI